MAEARPPRRLQASRNPGRPGPPPPRPPLPPQPRSAQVRRALGEGARRSARLASGRRRRCGIKFLGGARVSVRFRPEAPRWAVTSEGKRERGRGEGSPSPRRPPAPQPSAPFPSPPGAAAASRVSGAGRPERAPAPVRAPAGGGGARVPGVWRAGCARPTPRGPGSCCFSGSLKGWGLEVFFPMLLAWPLSENPGSFSPLPPTPRSCLF